MSSILDQVVTVGVESTYGTAQTSTVRSFEAKADTFQSAWAPQVPSSATS